MKSRTSLFLLLACLSLVGCGRTEQPLSLLIGTYGEAIHEMSYDPKTLSFNEIRQIPAKNASYVTINGDMIYSVSEVGAESGVYYSDVFVPGTGEDPCYILYDNGRVMTADYSGGSLSVFNTDAEGHITSLSSQVKFQPYDRPAPVPDRQESSHIHQLKIVGEYLLASDLGNDCIHVLRADSLEQVMDIPCGAGSGPRHMEMNADGSILYCLTELSGEVIVWKTDFLSKDSPSFTEIQRIQADQVNAGGSADIHLTSDGRFLFTSHRLANDGICSFSVAQDGTLSMTGYRNTGAHPRNFMICPGGKQIIVSCRDSHTLEVYDIDPESGLLSEQRASYYMPDDSPVCVISAQEK